MSAMKKNNRVELKAKVNRLPQKPGIYFFKNRDNAVVYIGKARSLRERVKSYLTPTSDPKVHSILAETTDVVLDQNPCNNSLSWYNSSLGACILNSTTTNTTSPEGFSASYLAVAQTVDATSDIPGWLPIVIIVLVGGVLITLVRMFRKQ